MITLEGNDGSIYKSSLSIEVEGNDGTIYKADADDTILSRSEVDNLMREKIISTDTVYVKSEIDSKLSDFADSNYSLSRPEVDNLVLTSDAADKDDVFSGELPDERYSIKKSANGSTLSLDSVIESEAINYMVYGNCVQDGTPTPDNNVPVECIGDLVTEGEHAGKYRIPIKVCGKNLFDFDTFCSELPKIENRVVIRHLDFNANLDRSFFNCFLPNTAYTFSLTAVVYDNVENNSITVYFEYTDGTLDDYNKRIDIKSNGKYVMKSNPAKTIAKCIFAWGWGSKPMTAELFDIQLEIGDTATEYEPYHAETVDIYLDEPLRKIPKLNSFGEPTDEVYSDYVDFQSGEVARKTFMYECTGEENWSGFNNLIDNTIRANFSGIPGVANGLIASGFSEVGIFNGKSTVGSSIENCQFTKAGLFYARINTSRCQDPENPVAQDWNNIYAAGTKIYGVCAEEVRESITLPPLPLKGGINNIFINNEIRRSRFKPKIQPSNIIVDYYQKPITDSLVQAILSQGANI